MLTVMPGSRSRAESAAAAFREWLRQDPRAARSFRELAQRQEKDEARWDARRRADRDQSEEAPLPKTKARASSAQLTSVGRGAQSLLAKVDVWYFDDGRPIYVQTSSRLFGAGPGRASLMAAPTKRGGATLRPDWSRAEFVWVAAVLYLDFHAVYRELRLVAPTRGDIDALIVSWPTFDQRPLIAELLARRVDGATFIEELRRRTQPRTPPARLLPVLALVSRIGRGAHILAADLSTLDLDELERRTIPAGVRRVRDLPDRIRRRLLERRDRQIHVRRIPALPQERGARSDERSGIALADIEFAGHSLSRNFSHTEDPPRRVVDVACDAQLTILYRQGPKRAALSAVGMMLGRSPSTVWTLVRQAKRLELVGRENTRQAE